MDDATPPASIQLEPQEPTSAAVTTLDSSSALAENVLSGQKGSPTTRSPRKPGVNQLTVGSCVRVRMKLMCIGLLS